MSRYNNINICIWFISSKEARSNTFRLSDRACQPLGRGRRQLSPKPIYRTLDRPASDGRSSRDGVVRDDSSRADSRRDGLHPLSPEGRPERLTGGAADNFPTRRFGGDKLERLRVTGDVLLPGAGSRRGRGGVRRSWGGHGGVIVRRMRWPWGKGCRMSRQRPNKRSREG